MTNKPEQIDGWCGICADCVPQINGDSGFKNCAEAHDAQLAEDIGMNKRLTDERIAELTKMADTYCITYAEESEDTAVALRELQERRKADSSEPVAWLHADNSIGIPAITRSRNVSNSWLSKGWNIQPLYTVPPAPVVPDDEREQFETWMLKKWGRERQEYDFAMGKFLHGENYADSYTRHMWEAWSASRAAILKGGTKG
nr:hypothetical protein [Citrobacter portucalensis]